MADLINEVSPSTCIVDCPSTNIETFTSYVTRHVANDVDLDVRHKADRDEVIVGAASIIAKVKRDAVIEALHDDVGVDFGSGYPSDPKTQRFIKAHYDDYDIFRTSWGTYQAVVAEEEQQTLNNM
jgi:ribonuclease HII